MNDFQLEGRYPDYQFKIFQRRSKDFAEKILDKIEPIRKCKLEKLQ